MDAMRLAAAGVIAGFEGREVLRGLDLTVPAGSRVALLGANGSGKTTVAAHTGGGAQAFGRAGVVGR